MKKKLLAILMALIMSISLLPVCATAETEPVTKIHYVAMGDSTSLGYYVGDDPHYSYSYQHNGSYAPSCEYSQYAMILQYLQEELYPDAEVTGADLSLPGFRPVFLRGILEESEHEKFLNSADSNLKQSYFERLDAYTNSASPYLAKAKDYYDGYDDIHKTFTTELKKADLITYDLLTIDTLTGLFSNMDAALSLTRTHRFASLMKEEGYSCIDPQANVLKNVLEDIFSLSNLPLTMVDNLIDCYLYYYASIVTNFSKNVDWIYQNNPDANMIVVIPCNCLSGVVVDFGGIAINVDRLGRCLIDAITAYLVNGDPHADWYNLADCSDQNELCLNAYSQGLLDDPDYGDLWAYIIKNDLSTDADLEAHYDAVKRNITAACDILNHPIKISLMDIAAILNADINRAFYAGIDADIDGHNYVNDIALTADKLVMVARLLTEERGLGIHPSAECCKRKAEVIKAACETSCTADEFYCVQFADFVHNSISAAQGEEQSIAAIKTTIAKLFTPVVYPAFLNVML